MKHAIRHIHFIGIGGSGMSAIAEVLQGLGYTISGSDIAASTTLTRLGSLGIQVHVGHAPAHIDGADAVVTTTAVHEDNPEVMEARARRIPVVPRAIMLAELMRLKQGIAIAGTHGKTTTTSLVASLLDAAGLDPTVVNGGIINAWGSNARLGQGDWVVAEADESDGTFIKLPATVAVVTNIDPEHLDHYGSFEALREAFVTFVSNIPFYGFAAVCIDHPEVQRIIPRLLDRRVITYGFSPQADVRGVEIDASMRGIGFQAVITDRKTGSVRTLPELFLPMFGQHNVLNALAAIAIAGELGIDDAVVRTAFANFGGVNRRFTKTGEVDGVTVIDDYAHHPVEIAAVLGAARSIAPGQVVAVVQPHRYSRLRDLFEGFCTCFNDADAVIVADVYPAGEAPLPGIDRDALVEGLRNHGHRRVIRLPDTSALAGVVADVAREGDMVVCLGAGSVSQWAHALPEEIAALRAQAPGGGQ